ncbi:hypothetical protein TgHK011_006490 [Trichoderma gracile]|nr:hypothetical protein TgHK011_006490 [Trichoderma gracile]
MRTKHETGWRGSCGCSYDDLESPVGAKGLSGLESILYDWVPTADRLDHGKQGSGSQGWARHSKDCMFLRQPCWDGVRPAWGRPEQMTPGCRWLLMAAAAPLEMLPKSWYEASKRRLGRSIRHIYALSLHCIRDLC